jgi:hypothetical protein
MDTDDGDRRDSVDLLALARREAEPYVGQTETVDELVSGIAELAGTEPSRARQLVESIAAAADDATHGRHTEQLDSVEQLVLHSLGLQAESLVDTPRPGPSDPDSASEVVDEID